MPHTKTALLVLIAFTLPGAAQALGLGEIHVDSALNEPLAAEIDIVGATAEDLAGIKASIADNETFLRFGVERPAFLSTATFKIATDGKGQPVLAIRSRASFTEPLIGILIDLRWRHGELIRQYTLLLDPPSFASDARFADAAPAADTPALNVPPPASPSVAILPAARASAPEPEKMIAGRPDSRQTVAVVAGATLRGIALHAGFHGEAGPGKIMVAIFRANPDAFEGNINRLRVGAELALPSAAEVSAISAADADSEIQSQMSTWRTSVKTSARAEPAGLPAVVASNKAGITNERAVTREDPSSNASDGATNASANAVAAPEDAALDLRVQVLEAGLKDLQGTLERQKDTLVELEKRAALANQAPTATIIPSTAKSGRANGGAKLAAALALAVLAFGAVYAWRRDRKLEPVVSRAEFKPQASGAVEIAPVAARREATPVVLPRVAPEPRPQSVPAVAPPEMRPSAVEASSDERARLATAVLEDIDFDLLDASYNAEPVGGTLDQTAKLEAAKTTMKICINDSNAQTMPLESPRFVLAMPEPSTAELVSDSTIPVQKIDSDTAKLQYKPLDLDGTVHHIQMPSILREKGGFKDRRTSLVDVLKIAVEREPSRRDLRMKLLETFFVSAASSRQGFLEVAKHLAGERANMSDAEWDKIAAMGRLIAADNDMFVNGGRANDEDLVNCA